MNTPTNDIIPQGFKMTELGALPEEWKVVKAKNYFLEIKQKVGFENKDKYKPVAVGELGLRFREEIYKHKTKLTEKTETYLIFPYCSICFGLGSKTLAVDVNTIKNSMYSVSAAYKIFKFDDNTFNPIFLGFYVKSVKDLWGSKLLVQSVRQGKKIDKDIFYNLSIPLPPLSEQQKIAAVLSAVQEAKEKTEAVIDATKALKKSMMKHLFTYGPVSPQEAENVPLKETEIGPVPEDWEVVRLGDTFEFSKKPRNLKIKNDDFVPFIPMEMISETNKSIKSWEEKRYSEISSGTFVFRKDIIIAKITPSFENGKQAILDNLPTDFGYATTEIWALHPAKNKKSITYYLHYYLKISSIRKILAGKMEGSTGRQRLPKNVLENLPMPLPPLPIQQKIASILSAIDEKIEAEENKKKALEELFKSLLHNLMTAKIRVNQLEISS